MLSVRIGYQWGYCIIQLMMEQVSEQVGEAVAGSSSLKSAIMNIAYTLKNNCLVQLPFSSRRPLSFGSQRERAYLLGRMYDAQKELDFRNDFEQIIWFSYRRLPQHCEDVGWGCMIRVIQMLLAQAVRRDQPQTQLNLVLDLFREEKQGPLSLSKICRRGKINARWTSCPELLMVASSILEELKQEGRIGFNFEIYCDRLQVRKYSCYRAEDFPKLIALHTRLGKEKTIGAPYLYHLFHLLKDRRFVGMATGKDSDALFVVGFFGELAILLDPHFVQTEESFRTFFPKNPQGIPFEELASGVTVSFYLPSLQQFEELVAELLYAQKTAGDYCCFELEVASPAEWTGRKGSDDFQLL